MTKTYNFSNPIYGRKWLRLLRDNLVSGIRILPDLKNSPAWYAAWCKVNGCKLK